jgi:hypothetical protein
MWFSLWRNHAAVNAGLGALGDGMSGARTGDGRYQIRSGQGQGQADHERIDPLADGVGDKVPAQQAHASEVGAGLVVGHWSASKVSRGGKVFSRPLWSGTGVTGSWSDAGSE